MIGGRDLVGQRAFLDGAGPAAIGAIGGAAVTLAAVLTQAWQFGVLAAALVALLALGRGVVSTLIVTRRSWGWCWPGRCTGSVTFTEPSRRPRAADLAWVTRCGVEYGHALAVTSC